MGVSERLREAADLLKTAAEAGLDAPMERAVVLVSEALKARLPVLVCGNGGSMADAQHIAGELVARFLVDRPGLKVLALGTNPAALTAWSNDCDYESAFAREVEAYGEAGGVLIALSTSGNSPNVVAAAEKARTLGMTVVAFTGQRGGRLAAVADVPIQAPAAHTPRIQELHLPLYHYLCEMVEKACA